MDYSLSFFRVFDLAFFVPGMLLFGAMWYSGCFLPFDALSFHNDTVHGILAGAFAVVFIYVLGLFCHGIQRTVYSNRYIWSICRKDKNSTPWYANLRKDNPRYELIMYFWYMRSTCWNLVAAIVLAVITGYYQHKLVLSLLEMGIPVFVIGVLVFLGCEFDEHMRKAAS